MAAARATRRAHRQSSHLHRQYRNAKTTTIATSSQRAMATPTGPRDAAIESDHGDHGPAPMAFRARMQRLYRPPWDSPVMACVVLLLEKLCGVMSPVSMYCTEGGGCQRVSVPVSRCRGHSVVVVDGGETIQR